MAHRSYSNARPRSIKKPIWAVPASSTLLAAPLVGGALGGVSGKVRGMEIRHGRLGKIKPRFRGGYRKK